MIMIKAIMIKAVMITDKSDNDKIIREIMRKAKR